MAKEFIGRLLIALVFILPAIKILGGAESHAELLANNYSRLFAAISTSSGFHLPVNPALVALFSKQIVIAVASLKIVGGFLFLLKRRIGTLLLIAIILFMNLVVHNPIAFMGTPQFIDMTRTALMSCGIIGGILLAN